MPRGTAPVFRRPASTPLRQALILLVLFSVIEVATLGVAFVKMRADLGREIAVGLEREMAGFDLSATPRAMSAIVAARARASDPARSVIVFLSDDGSQTGNAVAEFDAETLRLVPGDPSRPLSEAGYLRRIERLSGGVLVLGASLEPVRDLRETFFSLVLLSLVPTILLSLAIAGMVARRTARRVDAVERVLSRLSAGDLSARLPDPGPAPDDLGRIAAGVNRMAARQEAATGALRQVTSDIAHDLRTPLQRISVLLQDLGHHLAPGSPEADLADRAQAEAGNAVSVFQAMLAIAQIEGKGRSIAMEPLDLREIGRRVFELYQPAVEDAGDTLDYAEPDAAVTVRGNGDLLSQALANLVENAMRHTPSGSSIRVAVEPGPRLRVTDNGPGIPEAERGKVLERLYRLERSRTTPGHGLGLSLVAAIADLHGARLVLDDAGPGLSVTLHFPGADDGRP
ncbi:HAMP domain-containing protein [Rhodobacterales bacterium HKCCE2091]|nr:HAMP domain-containing protein [Rhodobacterales bacterium HKCCE2091]